MHNCPEGFWQIENTSRTTKTFLTFATTNIPCACMYTPGESYGASSGSGSKHSRGNKGGLGFNADFFLEGASLGKGKLWVTKGGPLPFAWDILSPQHQYGSKAFVQHPEDITDYKKLSFPEGFTWERVMHFEDGGVCCITNDSW